MENRWVRGYAIWEEKDIVCLSSNFDHSQLFISHKGRAFPQTSSKCQRGKKGRGPSTETMQPGCTITPARTAVRHNANTSVFPYHKARHRILCSNEHTPKEQHSSDSLAMFREQTCPTQRNTCRHNDAATHNIKDDSLLEFSALSSLSPSQTHDLC